MKSYVYILVISFFLLGCKKLFYKTEVKGRVIDNVTGAGIEGVKVYLLKGNSDLASSGSNYSNTDTYAFTGSDGSYSFSFNRSEYDNYGLYVQVDKNKYFQYGSSSDYIDLSFSKKLLKDVEVKDIYLKPLSKIKLHLSNGNNNYDSINGDIDNVNSSIHFQYNYPFNDTFIVNAIAGQYNLKIQTRKYSGATVVYDEETYNITCPSFDTVFYQIQF